MSTPVDPSQSVDDKNDVTRTNVDIVPRWHSRKADLPSSPPDRCFTFSKDVNFGGAKAFAVVKDAIAAAAYAERYRGAPLNEVLVDPNVPVHGVCDCDRPDLKFTTARVVQDLLQAWNDFLDLKCALPLNARPGRGCQISTATTTAKTSVHIKFDFLVASMYAHYSLTSQLTTFVLERHLTYPALVYDRLGRLECVIDLGIYTRFRSWRMLYMIKLGRANPLVPWPGCSPAIIDHLVGVYDCLPTSRILPEVKVPDRHEKSRLPDTSRLTTGTAASKANKTPEQYATALNSWPDTLKIFGSPIAFVSATDRLGRTCARATRDTVCPYAGRAHASNNVYLDIDLAAQAASVLCFDEDCREACTRERVTLLGGVLPGQDASTHDSVNRDSLHTQAELVEWNEDYDETTMRPLPIAPVVSVCAGMGTGKTKALIDMLRTEGHALCKVLVISYSRALCRKYAATFDAELPQLEIVNYLNSTGAITADCVIVCLDSLLRVETRNFDFVIIDEAVSVLSHFNSPHMGKTGAITSLFELLCVQAKHVHFLDAVVDSTAVRSVIDYICLKRGVASYDVRNRFIRPTNREVELVVSNPSATSTVAEQTLMHEALKRIEAILDAGKNVVVPTSTKGFATIVEAFLTDKYPDLPRKVYHSDAESVRLATIDADWVQLRALVYSPSISAGVSFELQHFDSLVAFFVSSTHTPSVDISLQQLFRVRQLRGGDMTVFVHVVPPRVQLPTTAADVGAMLTTDLVLLKRFCTNVAYEAGTRITGDRVCYDPDRLSYLIILGIVICSNRSAVSYTALMRETLSGDYAIPITTRALEPLSKEDVDIDMGLLRNTADAAAAQWTEVTLMDEEEFEALKERLSEATPAERASARLHTVRTTWGIDMARIDEDFYNNYVRKDTGTEFYYQAKRLHDIRTYTYGENRARMARKLDNMLRGTDINMTLFKNRVKEHYAKTLTLQLLLDTLLTAEQRSALYAYKPVWFSEANMESALERTMSMDNDEERGQLEKLFRNQGSTKFGLFAKVVSKAGGLKVGRGASNTKTPRYKQMSLFAHHEHQFKIKYQPACPWM